MNNINQHDILGYQYDGLPLAPFSLVLLLFTLRRRRFKSNLETFQFAVLKFQNFTNNELFYFVWDMFYFSVVHKNFQIILRLVPLLLKYKK